jgi:hypothetical protein
MSGWLAIGLVVIGLVAVAITILAFDVARGDVGGGRHTLARARRLLVVATDDATERAADRWVSEQRSEHPGLQCFVLAMPDDQELFMAIQDVIEREHPDALVMVRHEEQQGLTGTYGRLKEQLSMPIDTIDVPAGDR